VADGTDPAFAVFLLEQFVQDSAATVEFCRSAAAVADHEAALRAVHTLKSTSAQIGAFALSSLAGELEEHLRAGNSVDADSWSPLLAEYRRSLLAITAHLAHARPPVIRASNEEHDA